MAQSEKLEIEVTGKDSSGKVTIDQLRDAIAALETGLKGLRFELANAAKDGDPEAYAQISKEIRIQKEELDQLVGKLKELRREQDGVSDIGKQFGALGTLISSLSGGQLSGLSSAFSDVGRAGSAAGAAITAGLSPVLVVVGAITAALALLVAGFAAVIAIALDATKTANDQAAQVEGIKRVTGAYTEEAAAINAAMELAGLHGAQGRDLLAEATRRAEDGAIKQRKITEDAAAINAKAFEAELAAETAHSDRVVEINKAANERIDALAADQSDRDAAYAQKKRESETALAEDIADNRGALNDKLTSLDERHAEQVAAIAAQQAQASIDFDRENFERQRTFAEQQEAQATEHNARLKELDQNRIDAIADINGQILQAEADNNERREDAERAHNQKVVDLQRDIVAASEDSAQRRTDAERKHVENSEDLARRLADVETRLTEQIEALTDRRAERVRAAEESIQDLRDAFADRQAARQERLADQLTALDARTNDQREALQSRLINARDAFEQTALQAELDALNATTEAKKTGLTEAASAEDAKAEAEFAKKLARIQERLDREAAQQAEQTAKLIADAATREAAINAAAERETAHAIEQNARQAAADADRLERLKERLALENAAFAEQTSDTQTSYDRQIKALQDRITNENTQVDEQSAKLQLAYDARADKQAITLQRQTADAKRQNDQQLADVDARLALENKHYDENVDAANTKADAQLGKINERADLAALHAKQAYDAQTTDNQTAQNKILAATTDRLDKEQKAYDATLKAIGATQDEQLRSSAQALTPYAEGLKLVGLSIDDVKGKNGVELFTTLSTAIDKIQDPTKRAYAELVLLGSNSLETDRAVHLLAGTSMPDLIDKSKALGLAWTDADLKRQLDTAAAFREVDASILGGKTTAGKGAAPAAQEMALQMAALIQQVTKFMTDHAKDFIQFWKDLASFATGAYDAVKKVVDFMNGPDAAKAFSFGGGLGGGAGSPIGLPSSVGTDINQSGLDLRNRIIAQGGTNPADFLRILFGGNPVGANGTGNDVISSTSPTQIAGGVPIIINYNGTPAPLPGQVVQSLAVLGGP